ncbi:MULTISPECIES: Cof-type HAD-IIB family hydrolase [Loigolactobacillus]|uniref:Cof-type HAD-IIB family hydrolase n=1 Tax=Loigolactobacillus TaxID=2767889 RepID=UPI000F7F96B3|nr:MULTISPECIES: Cof-type HAD-IIB family hydrolase [Loigolactobacillus]MDA5387692.1 Cof-type HAD-IIB family hydrolase [Loigolactobacillus backii]MDA5390240.1 Cof-type HAD-IIB family hydrolase [Loigolactobacillus backii]
MYKMIVCDMDETLLDNQAKISKKNEQAIKAFTAQGGHFVLNTGRSFLSVQDNLKQLGLIDKPNQYVIAYNGGAIVENRANQILTVNQMPFETVKQIFDYAVKRNVTVHIYAVQGLYMWRPSDQELHYIKQRVADFDILTSSNIDGLKQQPLVKILYQADDPAFRKELSQAVAALLPDELTITFSSNRYVEFNPAGIDKGTATLQLAKQLRVKPSEIMAIGDNSNDLAMLNAAGLGVSVQNGTAAVKQAAGYVTQATNNESGVAEALEKFALI